MKSKATSFNKDWVDPNLNPRWSSWLKEGRQTNEAMCILCQKTIKLSNMGKQAILSHIESNKHKKCVNNKTTNCQLLFFQKKTQCDNNNNSQDSKCLTVTSTSSAVTVDIIPATTSQTLTASTSTAAPPSTNAFISRQSNLSNLFQKDVVTKAEIMCCLATVKLHLSNRGIAEYIQLFPLMFEDSAIAKKMKLKKDKIGYSITYGLAPYFLENLKNIFIGSGKLYVISFDVSFNKISQKEQQDLYIRFWDDTKNETSTKYLTSSFLGHTTATDLLGALKNAMEGFNLKNLLQLSMDGPNVNFKLLNDLKMELRTPDGPSILELGSCGLHTVHNSFKCAMKKNQSQSVVIKFLRALYNLVKNVPARRADFIRYTDSTQFPIKFCAVRWLENAQVAERALNMLPHLKKFIEQAKLEKHEPKCGSYEIVKQCVGDKMLACKLAFFKTVAEDLQPFLRKFQADKPMAPLLYEELHDVMNTILGRFIKKEVMDKSKSVSNLMKIKVEDPTNHKAIRDINLGFATKTELRKIDKELDIVVFKKGCVNSLVEFAKKMLIKSPLCYKIVRGISCLDPVVILEKSVAIRRLDLALESLVDAKRLSTVTADKISKYFDKFVRKKAVIDEIKSFNETLRSNNAVEEKYARRLDKLYFSLCQQESAPEEFIQFVKLVMILSHGNAAVERGFSVNSQCLTENLLEQSLIGQRIVYDAVLEKGVEGVEINKKMIHCFRNANAKYKEDLQKKNLLQTLQEKERIRKRHSSIKLKELEAKKRRVGAEAKQMESLIDEEIAAIKGNT